MLTCQKEASNRHRTATIVARAPSPNAVNNNPFHSLSSNVFRSGKYSSNASWNDTNKTIHKTRAFIRFPQIEIRGHWKYGQSVGTWRLTRVRQILNVYIERILAQHDTQLVQGQSICQHIFSPIVRTYMWNEFVTQDVKENLDCSTKCPVSGKWPKMSDRGNCLRCLFSAHLVRCKPVNLRFVRHFAKWV